MLRSLLGAPKGRGRHESAARFATSRRPGHAPRRLRVLGGALLAVAVIVGSLLVVGGKLNILDARPSSGDPLSSIKMFVDPDSPVAQAAASFAHSDPSAARLLSEMASQPSGIWFGSWNSVNQVGPAIRTVMSEAALRQEAPLLVLYAFPYHGCTNATTGASTYMRWVRQVVAAIGKGKAVVILEPDALAEYVRLDCLSPAGQRQRLQLIRQTVDQLAGLPNAIVYIDAGNSRWQPAAVMASLLLDVDVKKVRGFSLNVSNFASTAAEEAYGGKLGAILHGVHYVIDVSRNGTATATTWCNPPGQALGGPPTAHTGDTLVDGLLWIKPPWASDGICNGGPPAGEFWLSYALALAARARW
jgi:endoglucanase